ncbi:hypothetical protein [Nostoc sp. CALU 546]|uniref:hypothetical protein n=1 Tax=Nostoc sp. CALU 546 TaxID=1867241 RepID=UPI003B683242
MPTALIKDCRFFVFVIGHWSFVISKMPHAPCPMPNTHIHKISPQLIGNLTEILPQPLPNVGKV